MYDECCRSCSGCGLRACRETFPADTCHHGIPTCEDCSPGDCSECALELSMAVAS